MQTLTPPTETACSSNTAEPITIVKIDFAAGTEYFADSEISTPIPTSGKLEEIIELNKKLSSTGIYGEEKIKLKLCDKDNTLISKIEAGLFSGCSIEASKYFHDLSSDDKVVIFHGVITSAVVADKSIIINARSIKPDEYKASAVNIASKNDFPNISPDIEGTALPFSVGKVNEIKALLVKTAPKTTLSDYCGYNAMSFIVNDSSEFPSGQITLRIKQEHITGSFNANTFIVTERCAAQYTATVTARSGNPSIINVTSTDIPSMGNNILTGLFVRMTIDGEVQTRMILESSEDGTIHINAPFHYNSDYYTLPRNTLLEIFSNQAGYYPGTEVRQIIDEHIYIINDAQVAAVGECLGVSNMHPKEPTYTEKISITENAYEINLNDSTSFPSLGRSVATLKMMILPSEYPGGRYKNDDIFVTLQADNLGGAISTNPADIIKYILINRLGVTEGQLDLASFSTAATARSDIEMNFTLTETIRAGELLRQLCFQARLSLTLENGIYRLLALSNAIGTSTSTFTEQEILSGELYFNEATTDEGPNIATANYNGGSISVTDIQAGEFPKEAKFDFWALSDRLQVKLALLWWLQYWRNTWREVEFSTLLQASSLQRSDSISLDLPSTLANTLSGKVVETTHKGIRGSSDIDKFTVKLKVPNWQGCSVNCETTCEVAGCEAGSCESSCTLTCESTCQSQCQLSFQLGITQKTKGCSSSCQVSCRSGSEPACETGCEVGCQSSCEGRSFETTCPSGCESFAELQDDSSPHVDCIKSVIVTSAPGSAYADATVTEIDSTGLSVGDPFTATDAFDLHPAAGEKCSAVFTADEKWIIASGGRNVKMVTVVSGSAGSYVVQETGGWGSSFSASEA